MVLRRLAVSARTRADLRSHLLGKGIPEDVADSVLDKFAAAGLVDDLDYAQEFARMQATHHGQSRVAIAYKLRQRGVDQEHIDAALEPMDTEAQSQTARDLLRRRAGRWAGLDERSRREKQLALLGRRGFPMSVALAALDEQD